MPKLVQVLKIKRWKCFKNKKKVNATSLKIIWLRYLLQAKISTTSQKDICA